eukprot:3535495-Amphidinium_carterae.1
MYTRFCAGVHRCAVVSCSWDDGFVVCCLLQAEVTKQDKKRGCGHQLIQCPVVPPQGACPAS